MSRTAKIAAGLVVVLLGVVALVVVFTGSGSPREYVDSRYQRVQDTTGDDDSRTYVSPKSPSVVAGEIADAWKPGQRLNDPAGYFLRYSDTFIAVTADESGSGSRIYVDDEDRGYTRWYGYVGGYWGTYSGGGSFRGGGPGAGK